MRQSSKDDPMLLSKQHNIVMTDSQIRIKKYLEKHKIEPTNPRNDLPVAMVRPELIKISGSAHIAAGRITSRFLTNLRFRFASFR